MKARHKRDDNGRLIGGALTVFMSRINKTDGCWYWTGRERTKGYGGFTISNKECLAHRVSYEHFVGPIATGLFVCHRCDTPGCVNPAHLFLGTNSDNINDMYAKGRYPLQRLRDMPRDEKKRFVTCA